MCIIQHNKTDFRFICATVQTKNAILEKKTPPVLQYLLFLFIYILLECGLIHKEQTSV